MTEKKESEIEVAVLLVFFNRPEVLKQTFFQIKKARPSILLLYQDGPRTNHPSDSALIQQCRNTVSDIDWQCKVYTKYQEVNQGCDPSGYLAHTWAFSIVDKCIVLEDDCVPDLSFFWFCKEMLDRYEFDTRVCRISGMNHLGEYKTNESSYFFTTSGSIWGWASWRRVVSQWDPDYNFLNDKNTLDQLKMYCNSIGVRFKDFINTCKWHKKTGKEHFESIFYSYRLLNSGLTIVPSRNMICNIGLTADSTHATADIKLLPKGIQRVFNMKTYSMKEPIRHPQYVMNNLEYVKKVNKIMGYGFFQQKYRTIESLIRSIIYKKDS